MADKKQSESKHLEPSAGQNVPEVRASLADRGLDLALNVQKEDEQENKRIQPQGLAEDEILLPARTLRFPTDRSMGWLVLRRWNSPVVTWNDLRDGDDESLLDLGEARGDFHIPSGGEVGLTLSMPKARYVPPSSGPRKILADLFGGGLGFGIHPNDIQFLALLYSTDDDMALDYVQRFFGDLTDLPILHLHRYFFRDGNVCGAARSYITDEGLKSLRDMVGLRRLTLEGQCITGKGLYHLREMKKLEYLDLEGTLVGDEGLENIANLSGLEWLYLGNTVVTDAGCAYLENALPDCEIVTEPYRVYKQDDEG